MSTSKKKMAGKSSGLRRAKLAKLRQFMVLCAFQRLKPTYQMQPFSEEAIDALEEELRGGPRSDEDEVVIPRRRVFSDKREELLLREAISVLLERKPGQPWRYASRETLIKDLKALGIRSKIRKQRSG